MTGPGGGGTREKNSAPTIVPRKRRANGFHEPVLDKNSQEQTRAALKRLKI